MTDKIRTRRDTSFATDHELANEYRRMVEEGETTKRNLVLLKAHERGISTEQLKEIR